MTKLIQRMRNRRDDNDRWPPGSAGFSLRVSCALEPVVGGPRLGTGVPERSGHASNDAATRSRCDSARRVSATVGDGSIAGGASSRTWGTLYS